MFVQDDSGGIWVHLLGNFKPASAGEVLDLYGKSEQLDFAPQVGSPRWTVVGHAPLPKARIVTYAEMATTTTDSERVQIDGRVREASIVHSPNRSPLLWLDLAVTDGRIHASLPWDSSPVPANLLDAKIRVRGVSASDFNGLNQLIGLGILVQALTDIQVLEESTGDRTVPDPIPIGKLSQFGAKRSFGQREVFAGVVSAAFGRRGIYVRDDSGSVLVETRQDDLFQVGDHVQIRGFQSFSQGHIKIEDAILTRIKGGPAPKPFRPAMDRILSGEYDSQLIQLEGSVVDFLLYRNLPAFMVRKDSQLFSVVSNSASDLKGIPAQGSTVRITGICVTDFDEFNQRPLGFRLVVRSPDDIKILHPGPWWTPIRVLTLVVILVLGVTLTLLWVIFLRRRVASQTGMIRAAIESTADGIIAVDDHGKPFLWNQKFKEMWRVSDNLLNSSTDFARIREIVLEISDANSFLDHVRQAARSQSAKTDCQIELKDSRVFECHSELQVVNGRRVGRVWGFRDITDRIQAEAALRLRTEQQVAVSELSQFALSETNLETVLRRGAGMIQALLVSEGDTAKLGMALASEDFENIWTAFGDAASRERRFTDEDILFIRSVGTVLASALARKRTDEQLESAKNAAEAGSKAKSEFLAMMSHEIRTPMNGVIGMTSLLLETPLTDQQRDLVSTIQQSGEILLAVIADVLDFSKIEAGKLELESAPFRPKDRVGEVVRMIGSIADQKELQLNMSWDERIPDLVTGDAIRLRQVLLNLGFNAVKFTESGSVSVRGALESSHGSNARVRFEVEDTGIGISEEAQQKLFDSFMQADRSTTRRYGGTGLGLAISKRLVEMMGGQISLRSEVGKGSCFSFAISLPISSSAGVAENSGSKLYSSGPGKDGRTRALKILVAEDNEVNKKVLTHMLKRLGHEVEVVSDGLEAVLVAEVTAFDLILMDCQMPELDGFSASRAIRVGKTNRHTPIIAVTANAFAETREQCLAAGMSDYLSKPISKDSLESAMNRWVTADLYT